MRPRFQDLSRKLDPKLVFKHRDFFLELLDQFHHAQRNYTAPVAIKVN
jgi:hypothetical protein